MFGTGFSSIDISASGLNVYATWADERHAGGRWAYDVFFNLSTDGGRTWQVTDVRLNTSPAGAGRAGGSRLCSDGDRVYAIWGDSRNANHSLYLNRSLDGGRTWLGSDVRVDTDTTGTTSSYNPRIACDELAVHVVWTEQAAGADQIIRYRRSTDGGETWPAAPRRLSDIRIPSRNATQAEIQVEGRRVYVAWLEKTDTSFDYDDVYFVRSLDAGASWSRPRKLRTNPDTMKFFGLRLDADGDNVYVAWKEDRSVVVNVSTDAGDSWSSPTPAPGVQTGGSYDLRGSGQEVYLALGGLRDATTSFMRSSDGGGTWSTPTPLNAVPGYSGELRMRRFRDSIYVSWVDDRNGDRDIFFNYSNDRGVTWQDTDIRMNTDPPGQGGDPVWPAMTSSGYHVYLAWVDWRDTRAGSNAGDLYVNGSIPR